MDRFEKASTTMDRVGGWDAETYAQQVTRRPLSVLSVLKGLSRDQWLSIDCLILKLEYCITWDRGVRRPRPDYLLEAETARLRIAASEIKLGMT